MELLSKKLSGYFVRIGVTNADDEEVVSYGLFCFFSGTTQIAALFCVSLPFGMVLPVAVFVIPYGILKRTIGGWHSKHHATCLIGFTALTFACTLACRYTSVFLIRPAALAASLFMLVTVWLRAPVVHPNNPKRPEQLRKMKKRGRVISSIEWVVISILAITGITYGPGYLPLCGALGASAAAFTLLLPVGSVIPEQEGGERV